MKTRNIILLGVGGWLAYTFYKGYEAYQKLKFRISSVKIINTSYQNDFYIQLRVFLQIYNPTKIKLLLNSIKLDLYFQGVKVAEVNEALNFYINKDDVSTIPVDITLNATILGTEIWNKIKTANLNDAVITAKGNISVESKKIDIDYNYDLLNLLKV